MLSETRTVDSPWHRLPWTLPAALLIWAAALWGLAYFMEGSATRTMAPPPLNADLMELPPPAVTPAIQPERPVAPHKPKPLPRVRPRQAPAMPQPQVSTPPEQTPPARKEEATTGTGPSVLTAAPGSAGGAPGEGGVAAGGNTGAGSAAQAGQYGGKGRSRGDMYATSGARAIVRPMPRIPDDLREGAFTVTALARFHIAVDGSVRVELAKATPNPRLNGILLESLKKWRFIPAIKDGKPVASTEEIVVKIEVK